MQLSYLVHTTMPNQETEECGMKWTLTRHMYQENGLHCCK